MQTCEVCGTRDEVGKVECTVCGSPLANPRTMRGSPANGPPTPSNPGPSFPSERRPAPTDEPATPAPPRDHGLQASAPASSAPVSTFGVPEGSGAARLGQVRASAAELDTTEGAPLPASGTASAQTQAGTRWGVVILVGIAVAIVAFPLVQVIQHALHERAVAAELEREYERSKHERAAAPERDTASDVACEEVLRAAAAGRCIEAREQFLPFCTGPQSTQARSSVAACLAARNDDDTAPAPAAAPAAPNQAGCAPDDLMCLMRAGARKKR